jgi:CubicO group peptidase (beta-lactamase class C family)
MEFGKLDGQAPLAELIPELSGTWAERRTLDELLSHRAGLLAHVDLFKALQARCGRTRASLLRTAANSPLAGIERDARSFPPVYSDLGYILAGAAVEAQLGVRLDAWLARSVRDFTHGGVASIRQWLTEPVHPVHFAPTEVVPWRGGLLRGVVHDENAWLLSGYGLSGHAGLFGTALAVANFGMALLDSLAGRPSPIARAVTEKATARRPDSTLCSGFDRRADVGSSAGSYCSDETFGHLGFTGTSIWCDPERNAVAVLLTNRVCPSRDNLRIRELRPALHDALFRWADGDAR